MTKGLSAPLVYVPLTDGDVSILLSVAHFYERNMGSMRYFVRFMSSAEIKNKFRFVQQESELLEKFAERIRESLTEDDLKGSKVSMTIPALLAFWGRILASLHSKRSRRKLSSEEIERREALAQKLAAILKPAWQRNRASIEETLRTRRPQESEWIRQALETT